MARFNTADATAKSKVGSGPLATTKKVKTTHEGGTGYQRDTQSELFLHATTRFYGEDAFYQKADEGVDRLRKLVSKLAVTDEGWLWVKGFLPYLRKVANIRTAAIALAADAVHARLEKGLVGDGNRELISQVLWRADEPGEMIAYWTSRYGRAIPKPVKRGVAFAVAKLYNERSFLRYDSSAKAWRFGDVLDLTHPSISEHLTRQKALFEWAITARHNRDEAEPPELLRAVRSRWELSRLPAQRRHEIARGALTLTGTAFDDVTAAMAGQWEWLISWLGEAPEKNALTKAQQWEFASRSMGYMALLRNLRNFDEAGMSDVVANEIIKKFVDPEEVKNSRQLPFRFYSAYREAPSLRWGHAMDRAMTMSLANIPKLKGRSVVLVDMSGSMGQAMSGKSKLTCMTAATIFGMALKLQNPDAVNLHGFAVTNAEVIGVTPGMSLLKSVEKMLGMSNQLGGGTYIERAVRETYKNHDRVFIFTDMQTFAENNYWGSYVDDVSAAVPAHVPVYSWDLAGYQNTGMPVGKGNRHEMGGLTDSTFTMIPQIEAGQDAKWPWMQTA